MESLLKNLANVKVTPMLPSDLDKVREVQEKSYRTDNMEKWEYFVEKFNKYGEYYHVIRVDNEIVGYIIGFPWKASYPPELNSSIGNEDYESSRGEECFYLQDLCLDEHFRGMGLANYALNHLYNLIKEKNIKRVELVSNNDSGDYWDRNGFNEVEDFDDYRDSLKSFGDAARLMYREI